MSTMMSQIHPRRDGSVDLDFHRQEAARARAAYLRGLVSDATQSLPELSPGAKRKLSVFAAALVLATAAFWAIILTYPPQTSAAGITGVPVFEMMRTAPLDLPGLEADAI